MFELFEKIAEGIEFKIASNFSEKVVNFIRDVKKNASNSEDGSRIATSGNNSQIATSGNNSQIATSGYDSQIATSGYNSQISISGDNSVGFSCGIDSIVQAKIGTWISLCEYE